MPLRQPSPVRTHHQRNVRIRQRRGTPALVPARSAAGGIHQVRAPDDLADPLRGVVHDNREVVRERPVVAPHDEVIHHARVGTQDPVLELHNDTARIDPQSGHASGCQKCGARIRRQAPACPRVDADRSVRRRSALADLRPRAEALVHRQPFQRRLVQLNPRRLRNDIPVPVQSDRREIRKLLVDERRPHAAHVQVLDPHQKPRPAERANSQASSAVRRLPRCSTPVGEGAKRPSDLKRQESATSASSGASASRWEYSNSTPPESQSTPIAGSSNLIPASRRVVVGGALVDEVGDIAQHEEAVPEPDRDPQHLPADVVEHDAFPLAERGRTAAQVDDDVEHATP